MAQAPRTLLYRRPALDLDLWLPDGAARGLVVYAHGGGFVHGTRDDRIARHYGPSLAMRGIAFASIAYRRGGAPRRAFDPDMQGRIAQAAADSTAFYPVIRPSLFGPALYRAGVDFADAARFLLDDVGLGLSGLPWIALGNSSGGLAAIAVAHGLDGWTRQAELPPPQRAIAIAAIAPQPWVLTADGPPVSLLCARGDRVFPRAEVDRLAGYVAGQGLPVAINRIPYGQHTRPVKEILPAPDGTDGAWAQWLRHEIQAGLGFDPT